MAGLVERHLSALEEVDPAKLRLPDLDLLATVTNKVDLTGRRTFQPDQPPDGQRIQVQIGLFAGLGPTPDPIPQGGD